LKFVLYFVCIGNGVAGWPVSHLPRRYFTANLAKAGKKLVFWKSEPEAGILKINSLQ